jgi:hypothetical protein
MNDPKKIRWYAGLTAAAAACAVVLGFMSGAPDDAVSARGLSAKEAAELAQAVQSVNEAADATYAEQVDAWRSYLQSARSPQRLKVFVGELIGLEQKLRQGLELATGTSDEERVLTLFRERVLDERKLAAEMNTTIEAYRQFLFEQDRPILEAAGVSEEAWARHVKAAKPDATDWTAALQPVVARAISEARKDAARFAATTVAADLTGDGVKKMARKAGWDTSEEGGLSDWVSGVVVDLGAGVVIDALTDATDTIVARLNQEMASAEYALLDGEEGLFASLRRIKSAHETARNALLTTAQGR